MKNGMTLNELAAEITRQHETKRDYVVATEALNMTADGNHFDLGDKGRFEVTPFAQKQVAEHCGIPAKYAERMKATMPDLWAHNVNMWLAREPSRRMIRTLDDKARAFVSDKFSVAMDNYDLANAVLPAILKRGAEVLSCSVTETKLYIKAVDQRITRDIPVKGARMGDGSHVIFDTVSPAIVVSNSEVGAGALSIQTSIYTRACTNLAVFGERSIRRTHVGARHELTEGFTHLLTDATKRLTDAALWAQVKDITEAALEAAKFGEIADELVAATTDKIETTDVVKVVEVAAKKYGANEGEKNSILKHLIEGGDLSRYGLSAAVTRASQDFDSYDRASEFERVGGAIIELPKAEWKEIAEAA